MIEKGMRKIVYYAIVIKLRYWDIWSIILVLFMRYYIYCKNFRPDIVFAIICYLIVALFYLRLVD